LPAPAVADPVLTHAVHSPVIVCPSVGYRPKAIALPQPQCLPARAGSFSGTRRA
jgi:hypothetical protein